MDHFDKKELKFKNIFKIYEKQHKKGLYFKNFCCFK